MGIKKLLTFTSSQYGTELYEQSCRFGTDILRNAMAITTNQKQLTLLKSLATTLKKPDCSDLLKFSGDTVQTV